MKTISVKPETWKRIKTYQIKLACDKAITTDDIINLWADAYESIVGKVKR